MGMNIKQALHDHVSRIDTADWLEIGTDNGSEQTALLSDLCPTRLYSVDVDPNRIDRNIYYYRTRTNIQFVCQDGSEFLQQHQGQFSLVFLDNFDWDSGNLKPFEDKRPNVQQQIVRYTQIGMNMNNLHSQAVHLNQCMAVLPLMRDRSVIIIDDTYLTHDGVYAGKGGACVPYLLTQGWQYKDYEMGVAFWKN